MIAMRYLTDGINLYGRQRGTIRYTILRDCISEATATIDDLHLAALSPVR
jgi:hypothetical protein